MNNQTREKFDSYLTQIAKLNRVDNSTVLGAKKFTVEPSVQQKLHEKMQDSSEFLKKINTYFVTEAQGENIGLGVGSTVAGTTDTANGATRTTRDISALNSVQYHCQQINFDTHIRYAMIDQWAKFPDFQLRLRSATTKRISLDLLTILFNGTKRAATSDRTTNPLLQDVGKGVLQKIRENAKERYVSDKLTVGAGQTYQNLDALVFDAVKSHLAAWYQEDPELVVILGRELLADKYFPLVNKDHAPSEMLASDIVISQKRVGGLPAVSVPFFPANGFLITRLDNLSLYVQEGSMRRHIKDVPERDRIEDYISENVDFVVEDYECVSFYDNVTIAGNN